MTKNYAVLNGNLVTNVIVADTLTIAKQVTSAECVECDGSFGIGWTRSGKDWIAPVIATVEEVIE
jgi:hypothetical protein